MNKSRANFIVILTQISFFSNLVSSYVQHNLGDNLELITKIPFLLLWSVLYILTFTYIKGLGIARQYYSILFIVLFLTTLGIIIGQRPHNSLYTYLQLFTYLHIFLYLSTQSIKSNILLLGKIILYSVLTYILFNFINIYRNGNSLYTIGMIQLPLWIFAVLVIFSFNKKIGLLLLVLKCILIYIIYKSAIFEVGIDSVRLQYLPLGLSVMIILSIFLIWLNLSTTFYLSVFFSLITIFLVYFEEFSQFFLFENRMTSFLERFHIFLFMLRGSFFFILPQGLGSSLQEFDLSKFDFIGARALYPPHSGVAVILYDFSIFGVAFLIYVVSKILKTTITENISGPILNTRNLSSKTLLGSHINYFPFSLNQLKLLKWLVISIWLIQNLFYLKGVITADYFSDDGIVIYMLLYLIVRKSIDEVRLLLETPSKLLVK